MKFFLISLFLLAPLLAQEVSPEIAALRTQLRDTALLLRAAQTEKANALATFAASEAKNEVLQKEIDSLNTEVTTLTKRASEEGAASEKALARLADTLAGREKNLREYAAALEKWKIAFEKMEETAREKEAARATASGDLLVAKNTIADRERKNLNLYMTSLEILERYENYALGKALSAREPFIQKTRVKVENEVQDYKDKVIDNRISAQPN